LIQNDKSEHEPSKEHWLRIGAKYLEFIENPPDSFRKSGQDARLYLAEKSGKSVETIHKIIAAATWVKAHHPHDFENPSQGLRMTQVLKLRSLHRRNPGLARYFAATIFHGAVDRFLFDQALENERRFSEPHATNEGKLSSPAKWTVEEFQSIIHQNLGGAISGFDNLDTVEISEGSGVFPPCDFLISPDGGPCVAVETKPLKPQMRRNKIVSLAGLCALWQNQGYKVWVFASQKTDREQNMFLDFVDRANLDPIQIVMLDDLTFSESEGEGEADTNSALSDKTT